MSLTKRLSGSLNLYTLTDQLKNLVNLWVQYTQKNSHLMAKLFEPV